MIKKEQYDMIFQAIKIGTSNITDICLYADVSREWYYDKLKDDPKFAARVEKAINERKMRAIGIIQKAALTRWPAAAWFLERKYPEEYALRYKAEITGKGGRPLMPKSDLSKVDDKELEKLNKKLDAYLRPNKPESGD